MLYSNGLHPPRDDARTSSVRAADVLSLSRLVAAPLLAYAVLQPSGSPWAWLAAGLYGWAALSDVLDGRLARRAGTPVWYGRWVDHGSDIGFLLIGLSAFCHVGVLPWWVPASIGCAFATYVLRQILGTEAVSRWAGRIGHWGGVANFVLLGILVVEVSLGWRQLPNAYLHVLYTLVPVYSFTAVVLHMVPRLLAVRSVAQGAG